MSEKTASVPPGDQAPPYTPDPPAGSSSSSSLIGSGMNSIMSNALNSNSDGDLPARVDDPQPRQSLFDAVSKWSNGTKDAMTLVAILAVLYSVVTGTMGATGWGTATSALGGSSGLIGVTDTNGLWCKAVDGKIECVEQAPIKHNFPTAGSLCRVRNDGDELSMECDVDPDEFRRPYGVPIGSIQAFAGDVSNLHNIETGWLWCNGSEVGRVEYSELFSRIGIAWGPGNGVNTFHLPDLRGTFLRGVDAGRSQEPGSLAAFGDVDTGNRTASRSSTPSNGVGSKQANGNKEHSHLADATMTYLDNPYAFSMWVGTGNTLSGIGPINNVIPDINISIEPDGGLEARPNNYAVHYIIKAQHI